MIKFKTGSRYSTTKKGVYSEIGFGLQQIMKLAQEKNLPFFHLI